jgi:hypothetical protein
MADLKKKFQQKFDNIHRSSEIVACILCAMHVAYRIYLLIFFSREDGEGLGVHSLICVIIVLFLIEFAMKSTRFYLDVSKWDTVDDVDDMAKEARSFLIDRFLSDLMGAIVLLHVLEIVKVWSELVKAGDLEDDGHYVDSIRAIFGWYFLFDIFMCILSTIFFVVIRNIFRVIFMAVTLAVSYLRELKRQDKFLKEMRKEMRKCQK